MSSSGDWYNMKDQDPNLSHCSPLQPTLTWQFQSGGISWKVLPLQPIAAHSYMAFLVRGVIPEKSSHCSPLQPTLTWQFQSGGNSWKVLPLQPIAAHSYMAFLVRGVIPEKSSHCSPLQPTLTWQFQSGEVIPEKSSHCSPLQPTHTWQFQSGGNSSKVLPLQPKSYIILPPMNKLLHTLTSIYPHRQITPHSYIKMGEF